MHKIQRGTLCDRCSKNNANILLIDNKFHGMASKHHDSNFNFMDKELSKYKYLCDECTDKLLDSNLLYKETDSLLSLVGSSGIFNLLKHYNNAIIKQNIREYEEMIVDLKGVIFKRNFLENQDKNGYDSSGYDINGYNKNGYDIYGYNIRGFDEEGYDEEGYNTKGYNKEGLNWDGFTIEENGSFDSVKSP